MNRHASDCRCWQCIDKENRQPPQDERGQPADPLQLARVQAHFGLTEAQARSIVEGAHGPQPVALSTLTECPFTLQDAPAGYSNEEASCWSAGCEHGWNASLAASAPALPPSGVEAGYGNNKVTLTGPAPALQAGQGEPVALSTLTEALTFDLKTTVREYVADTLDDSKLGDDWTKGFEECKRRIHKMLTAPHNAGRVLAASAPALQAGQGEPEDGPIVDGWQISVSSGHSGYGVYAHMTEYPEEGAVLLLPIAIDATNERENFKAHMKQQGHDITERVNQLNANTGEPYTYFLHIEAEWRGWQMRAALSSPTHERAAPAPEAQAEIDALWMYAQLYADEHAASIDPLRTLAGIEGAKRRKASHEVALRQGIRELAERASAAPSQPVAAPGRIPLPKSEEEARMMVRLGTMWLNGTTPRPEPGDA